MFPILMVDVNCQHCVLYLLKSLLRSIRKEDYNQVDNNYIYFIIYYVGILLYRSFSGNVVYSTLHLVYLK